MKHPFETKRVIVAGCAAIAMVLGSMSVGASFMSNHESAKAGISSVVDAHPDTSASPTLNSTALSRQHTLEVSNFLQQGSPLRSPASSTPGRSLLAPVFATGSPLQLMDQMTQLQPATPPNNSGSASDGTTTAKDTGTTTPDDNGTTGGTSGDSQPTEDTGTAPEETTPGSNDAQTAPGTMSAMDAKPAPAQ